MLAALENALRLTGRLMETTRVVVSGAGAAGVAVTRILLAAGIRDVAVVDRTGVLPPRAATSTPPSGRSPRSPPTSPVAPAPWPT